MSKINKFPDADTIALAERLYSMHGKCDALDRIVESVLSRALNPSGESIVAAGVDAGATDSACICIWLNTDGCEVRANNKGGGLNAHYFAASDAKSIMSAMWSLVELRIGDPPSLRPSHLVAKDRLVQLEIERAVTAWLDLIKRQISTGDHQLGVVGKSGDSATDVADGRGRTSHGSVPVKEGSDKSVTAVRTRRDRRTSTKVKAQRKAVTP